ncbi:hypothetical protein NPIL_480821 [Nephila pilipes]|uniref:Uncharacterized protein n=1 Tax=Nephila pilipes TaxID=299642 RepID=A0A8X6I9M5_NEPPI|nr:hypothetical protein NPIL_480821 [Nephila pilipes]
MVGNVRFEKYPLCVLNCLAILTRIVLFNTSVRQNLHAIAVPKVFSILLSAMFSKISQYFQIDQIKKQKNLGPK